MLNNIKLYFYRIIYFRQKDEFSKQIISLDFCIEKTYDDILISWQTH